MKALVVDDSRAIRMILSQILKELGYEVLQASDGREASQALTADPDISLMLVDWNMPEMNGYELVTWTRSQTAYNDVLIMMVTTETEVEQISKALEAGANEFVMKPFTKDVILDKLQMLGVAQ